MWGGGRSRWSVCGEIAAELEARQGHDAEALEDLAGEAGEREEGEAGGRGPLEV